MFIIGIINKHTVKKEKNIGHSCTFNPCHGKHPLLKYISTYPNDSISSRRLKKDKNFTNINI